MTLIFVCIWVMLVAQSIKNLKVNFSQGHTDMGQRLVSV